MGMATTSRSSSTCPGYLLMVKSLFTVNSFRGQTFDEVENAYCRLVNAADNKEIAKYNLSGGGSHTAMIMAKVYRHNGEWKMHAIGEPTSGQTIQTLSPCQLHLKPFPR